MPAYNFSQNNPMQSTIRAVKSESTFGDGSAELSRVQVCTATNSELCLILN